MEIITNNRGGVKVCNKGYTYTKKSSDKSTIRSECSKHRSRSCKGALKSKRPKGQRHKGQKTEGTKRPKGKRPDPQSNTVLFE